MILSEISDTGDEGLKNIEVNAYKEEAMDLGAYDVESAPIVNYVNRVLLMRLRKRHQIFILSIMKQTIGLRFRQHGVYILSVRHRLSWLIIFWHV